MTAVLGHRGDTSANGTGRPLLVVSDLVKEFPAKREGFSLRNRHVVHAVSGVSFALNRGETVGLVGESGSGKSTLARLVLRLIEPTAGRVVFGGDDVLGMDRSELRAFRQRAQLVFQDPHASFDPMATVFDSVTEPVRTHRHMGADHARDGVAELFRTVGLDRSLMDRRPAQLSGGQLQRAGIARALAVEPELLVLDEPVSSLDVSTQGQVINLLDDLKEQLRIAYLFIAHDLSVVRHVSDRIIVMYLGRIVESGPAAALYDEPSHPYTQALLSAIPVPDPTARDRRARIKLSGDIPSPINPPSGCRFRTRCPFAMDVCAKVTPEPTKAPHGGLVWCHLQAGAKSVGTN